MACFFATPLHQTSSSTLILIRPVVPTLAGSLQVTQCSWATTLFLDPQSVRTSSLILSGGTCHGQQCGRGVLASSTACRATQPPITGHSGLATPSISSPTTFNTNIPNMLRLIFNLSTTTLHQEHSYPPRSDDFLVRRDLH
jgi:hypothetical protein